MCLCNLSLGFVNSLRSSIESTIVFSHSPTINPMLMNPCDSYRYTLQWHYTFDSLSFCIRISESSYRGSISPTEISVLGQLIGKRLSSFYPPTNYSVRRIGEASGWFAVYILPPRYELRQSRSMDGHKSGSTTALIFDGLNLTLKSNAG